MNEEQLNEVLSTMENSVDVTTTQVQIEGFDSQLLEMAQNIIVFVNSFWLLFFIFTAIWLFLINKKLWEKYPWLSFVPIIQIYNYLTAANKSFVNFVVFPVLALIIGFFLSFFTFWLSLLIASIYAFVMWVILVHSISKRTGYWVWATIWFIFVPFIMYPIVGYKMKDKTNENSQESNSEL